jgi:carbamoyltransferase
MKILGISAYYHDSGIALIDEGKIIFAAQEERFTRKKHDSRFPNYCNKILFGLCKKFRGHTRRYIQMFYDNRDGLSGHREFPFRKNSATKMA